jgi:enamine deaminase RidA (YjgF/YER057c/UK114 family)
LSPSGEIYVPQSYRHAYAEWHFAPVARSGDLVFVSGVVGFEKGTRCVIQDPEQQFRAAFDLLRELLAANGAGMDDIVDLTTFLTPGADRALLRKVRDEYLPGPAYPAATAVVIHALSFGAIVEIKAVALRNWDPAVVRGPGPA